MPTIGAGGDVTLQFLVEESDDSFETLPEYVRHSNGYNTP